MMVDFVLVSRQRSETDEPDKNETLADEKRLSFEAELTKLGLELKKEVCGSLNFVLLHAPKNVLKKYCDIMKLHMPIKKSTEDKTDLKTQGTLVKGIRKFFSRTFKKLITLDPRDQNKTYKPILLAEYTREKSYLFDDESDDFFSPTVRILVVDFILNQQKWSDDGDKDYIGIQQLLNDGTYAAAYPLHDGGYKQWGTTRNDLFVEWAQLKNWIKYQPIDKIKEYLGVKHAFYFAWLGFYNHLLLAATFAGLMVLIFGFLTVDTDQTVLQTCSNSSDSIMLCPRCDKICGYQKLSDACLYVTISHLFDNPLTVFFAFFMSVWGTVFLELWKRYSAVLTHSWGLTGYCVQAEQPQPRYLEKLANSKHKKVNVVTNRLEPIVPFWSVKLPITLFSYTVILFFVLLAIGAVLSVVLFRMWMITAFTVAEETNWLTRYSSKIVTVTGSSLNLISIMILNQIYQKIAIYLTNLELHRTQSEFDRSLTIKIYLFQFVNYYASLIYMAFFKGKFVGYPGKYRRILGLRQEECNKGGCLTDLSFQLAFIMIGKQILGCALEMYLPMGKSAFNTYSVKKEQKKKMANTENEEIIELNEYKQWIEDYKLLDWNVQRGLFYEYLEMVVQFGFVTLFVTAFPLAPFFALLNNIFELRFDAQKALKYYRRPIPHLLPNIGVWYRILDIVGKLAVITNGVIIAFSTNFIPKLIYRYTISPDFTINGYWNYSLSYFNTSDFANGTAPLYSSSNVTICRYRGFRDPPWMGGKYNRSSFYLEVLIARILFIVLFQNVVYATKMALQWLIPDTPQKLKDQIRKESYMTTQLIIKREKEILLNVCKNSYN